MLESEMSPLLMDAKTAGLPGMISLVCCFEMVLERIKGSLLCNKNHNCILKAIKWEEQVHLPFYPEYRKMIMDKNIHLTISCFYGTSD